MNKLKLPRYTLSGDAYTAVRDLLLGGSRYAPGDKVSIEALSRDLGVNRSPVWMAVSRACLMHVSLKETSIIW